MNLFGFVKNVFFLYATIGTSLPFKKSILERLENFNFTQNLCFGPTQKDAPYKINFLDIS